MKPHRKLDLTKVELENLYQFYSCAQIAGKYGVNPETVRKLLHEYEIKIGKAGGRRSFNPPKEVLEALYQQKSMAEIAKHFGVGETVVFNRLKEHGIKLAEHKNHRLKPGRIFTDEHRANLKKAHIENNLVGERNPNWKGGLTEKNRQARNSWQYRDWKKQSLINAGYKCEVCGVDDGRECECCGTKIKLHVHHIKSFSKFPELRFDVQNSKVLCPKCHRLAHQ